MTRRPALLGVLAALLLPASASAQAPQPDVPLPPYPGSFELIGHEPLMNRGMNAALAVFGGYAYVGSRTDGTHANAGVMVVDVRDPAAPEIVKEIGPPDEGMPTQSSRELRILPDQKLLLVLNHQCSELIHRCASPSNTGQTVLPSNIKIFDIAGENAANPKLVATYEPEAPAQGPQLPHEFFVWNDPNQPGRVLVYMSVPNEDPNLMVVDFSRAREGIFPEVARFTLDSNNAGLHSMTVSNDGKRMYIADLTNGVFVADTSEVAAGKADAKIKQLTNSEETAVWDGPGAHSSIKLPGREGHVMVTDEVYGMVPGLLSNHGCPWGWVRFLDVSNEKAPAVESEYRLPVNQQEFCGQISPDRNSLGSLASHNPTLTEHLALLSWHGAGMQALVTDPKAPTPAAGWLPTPLPAVQTEDPLLSAGQDKVVMWSFPSVVDGLVYVVDIRNGLYVLRYHGPYESEVSGARFLDGASNSGDVQRIEPVRGSGGTSGSAGGTRPGGTPAIGGPSPCLFSPITLKGSRLGPFALKMTMRQAELRGGPPGSVRKRGLSWCVRGSGKIALAFKKGRTVFIATSTRALKGAGRLVPGRKGRNRLVIKRAKKVSRVALIRGGKVRWSGIAAGRPSARAVRALAKASGI